MKRCRACRHHFDHRMLPKCPHCGKTTTTVQALLAESRRLRAQVTSLQEHNTKEVERRRKAEGERDKAIELCDTTINGWRAAIDLLNARPASFIDAFATLTTEIHANARDKGWWDTDRNDGECIALMHSELSEALEALRHGNGPDDKIPAFSGLEAEMADTIIRIMDFAGARGLCLGGAILAKHEFNKTRPHMHGGKKF